MKNYYFSTKDEPNTFMIVYNANQSFVASLMPEYAVHITADWLVREGAEDITRRKFLRNMDDAKSLACAIYHKAIHPDDLVIVPIEADY